MGKISIPNKLNHKPQAHVRVCEENKKELEKKNCLLKYFVVEGLTLEGYRRTETPPYGTPSVTKLLQQHQEYFIVILHRVDIILHRYIIILHQPAKYYINRSNITPIRCNISYTDYRY